MTFEELFPGILTSAAKLHSQFGLLALVILMVSFLHFYWTHPSEPVGLIRHLTTLFLLILLIQSSHGLIMSAETAVDEFVKTNVAARPEHVSLLYREKIQKAQPDVADPSWTMYLNPRTWVDAIVSILLGLVTLLAMAILFYVDIIQRAALLLCWAISPLLFACLAIRPLAHLGVSHLFRIAGILSWKLGLALAATVTEGLLTQQVIPPASAPGMVSFVITSLLSTAFVGIWILVSTIAAPVYMQRLIAGQSGLAGSVSANAAFLFNRTGPTLFRMAGRQLRAHGKGGRLWGPARAKSSAVDFPEPPLPQAPPVSPDRPRLPPSDPNGSQTVARLLLT